MSSETILPVHSPSFNPTYPPMAAANHTEKPAQDASATAHGAARLTVHIPSAFRPNAARAKLGDAKRVSRLASIEFRIYYVVVALAIPAMVWIPMALSDRERPAHVVHRDAEIDTAILITASHRNYPFFAGRLSPGWINGRAVVSPACVGGWGVAPLTCAGQ